MTPRVVFDCIVFLQAAARATGPAAACLAAVRDGRVALVVSPDIIAEVRDVLTRPATLRKFPALTPEAVETFLDGIMGRATVLAAVPVAYTLERDPKDEPYINLALAAGADYLVSRDKDLLDLMADEAFRRLAPGLVVLDPVALLRILEARSQPE